MDMKGGYVACVKWGKRDGFQNRSGKRTRKKLRAAFNVAGGSAAQGTRKKVRDNGKEYILGQVTKGGGTWRTHTVG